MEDITADELNATVDEYLAGDDIDQGLLDKELDQIIAALKSSDRCMGALQGGILHAQSRGPEHVACGMTTNAAAFLMLGLKLAQRKHKQKADLAELNRIFGLGGAA